MENRAETLFFRENLKQFLIEANKAGYASGESNS